MSILSTAEFAIKAFVLQLRKYPAPGRWWRHLGRAMMMAAGSFAVNQAEGPWWMQGAWLASACLFFFFYERKSQTTMNDDKSPDADDQQSRSAAPVQGGIDISSGAMATQQSTVQDYRNARFDNVRFDNSTTISEGLNPRLTRRATAAVVLEGR
ncbi:hypothetical protein [Streptosporangium sp. NPDC006930]|uniref:hypothetical protein n=1 Tax=Streptosporangium sp. NPDC006930 TaxID=3154783 RepID=UPI00344174C1